MILNNIERNPVNEPEKKSPAMEKFGNFMAMVVTASIVLGVGAGGLDIYKTKQANNVAAMETCVEQINSPKFVGNQEYKGNAAEVCKRKEVMKKVFEQNDYTTVWRNSMKNKGGTPG